MRYWVSFSLKLVMIFSVHLAVANDKVKTLRVGAPQDFPPFYYVDNNGVFKGVSYEVFSLIANQLNYQIELTRYPNMRLLLAELEAGQQDVVMNLSATDERNKIALFTKTPHIYETQDLIVRADSSVAYTGQLLQLAPYKLGVIYGWTYGDQFDTAKYLKKRFVNDSQEQLRGLFAGRYDIALNNQHFFRKLSDKLGLNSAFKVLTPSIYKLPVSIAVSKKHPQAEALIKQIEQQVQVLIKTDAYKQILQRNGFKYESVILGDAL
ncbi:amino acid ABC transporter periplasmic protein [Catenovulum agarivorans DS-2]|uniref:Amino acid ABC transporter periplasmic protein n=1 Tax=Catenovulum agarivorans DS-2 TaxID=1328313 RepID=W7QC23_9ALTE|nr:transporter substrate-binding domain-containing protein [Catenovulum agarivorans]EWH10414.1 amino acid ABC transporter periplasmic protein [Catenovulum agarivorans DS-2]